MKALNRATLAAALCLATQVPAELPDLEHFSSRTGIAGARALAKNDPRHGSVPRVVSSDRPVLTVAEGINL